MSPIARELRRSAAALFLAAAAVHALAADKPCSKSESTAAEKFLERASSWSQLQQFARDHGNCDQGTTADVVTEALMRLTISDWKKIGDFEAIAAKDPDFKRWVLGRLASPLVSPDDADMVRDLARGSCPKGRESLCAELRAALEPPEKASPPAKTPPAAAPAPTPPPAPAAAPAR